VIAAMARLQHPAAQVEVLRRRWRGLRQVLAYSDIMDAQV
jgi:hypothetical protein